MRSQRPAPRASSWAAAPRAAQPAPAAADLADQLRRIRRNCAAIRGRMPQASWDLAVIETTAAAALEHGCRPADVSAIRGRLLDLLNCFAALSEELDNITGSAARL
jgi:hypothetical protein